MAASGVKDQAVFAVMGSIGSAADIILKISLRRRSGGWFAKWFREKFKCLTYGMETSALSVHPFPTTNWRWGKFHSAPR